MTPSGEMADIILPAAHPNEVDRVEWAHSARLPTSHTYLIRQPFHAPLGEAKDDMDICFEFAKYMDVDMYWKDKYEFFDYMVKGPETLPPQLSCASFEEFRERVSVTGVEMAAVKGAPKYGRASCARRAISARVSTPCTAATRWARSTASPAPPRPTARRSRSSAVRQRQDGDVVRGPAALRQRPASDVHRAAHHQRSREDLLEDIPTLITGGRSHAFFHTEYRNSPWMREVHMFPTMDINPETAAKLGIKQDDWCWIETYVDRIRQRANLTNAIKPDTIHAEHDWWFPDFPPPTTCTGPSPATATCCSRTTAPTTPPSALTTTAGCARCTWPKRGAEGICMNADDLKVFLPLSAEELAADEQHDGVAMWTKGRSK